MEAVFILQESYTMKTYYVFLSLIFFVPLMGMEQQKKPVTPVDEICEQLGKYFKQEPSEETRAQEYDAFVERIYANKLRLFDCVSQYFIDRKKEKMNEAIQLATNRDEMRSYLHKFDAVNRCILINKVVYSSDVPTEVYKTIERHAQFFNYFKKQSMNSTDKPIYKQLTVYGWDPTKHILDTAYARIQAKKWVAELPAYKNQEGHYPPADDIALFLVLNTALPSGPRAVHLDAIVGHEFVHLFYGDNFKMELFDTYHRTYDVSKAKELPYKISRLHEKTADGIYSAYSVQNAQNTHNKTKEKLTGDAQKDAIKNETHPSNRSRDRQARVILGIKKAEQELLEKNKQH